MNSELFNREFLLKGHSSLYLQLVSGEFQLPSTTGPQQKGSEKEILHSKCCQLLWNCLHLQLVVGCHHFVGKIKMHYGICCLWSLLILKLHTITLINIFESFAVTRKMPWQTLNLICFLDARISCNLFN